MIRAAVMASLNRNGEVTTPGIMREPSRINITDIPHILPHEKVFPIQIGSQLFRLSGASISSDAPSYFSAYFKCQLAKAEEQNANGEESHGIKTLYIDRDPVTFADISRHLQGYHIQPRDGAHFVKLFADAQFYQLPRLVDQLFEDNIYICIGGREFRVQKDLFTAPGDSPNYFTFGFGFMFASADTIFPGLDREGLIRPPSIIPPAVPNRSGDIFAELIHMLKGYPLHIRNETHRTELLRDCRYFLFKGLEQKLIPHHISHNLLRGTDEITIGLENIRQPGLSVTIDSPLEAHSRPEQTSERDHRSAPSMFGRVQYSRPFVDSQPYELILEISGECMRLDISSMRAEFFGDGKKRISKLFEVVVNKLSLPTTQLAGLRMTTGGVGSMSASPDTTELNDGEKVRVVMDSSTSVVLDGQPWRLEVGGSSREKEFESGMEELTRDVSATNVSEPTRKRRRLSGAGSGSEDGRIWTVRTGQWRLRVQSAGQGQSAVECVLVAVKIDAFTGELARNGQRGFLGGSST